MDLTINIPEDVWYAMRLPETEKQNQLIKELAITLYQRGILSFGKARALAHLSKWEFDYELSSRQIVRHYNEDDLENDLKYGQA
jgi:predicted HTH domain antitoxin